MDALPSNVAQEAVRSLQPESWRTRLFRWKLNFFPPFWCSGGRITYISADFREVHLSLPLSLRTRNLVGTTYGGSMFAATDAVYFVMLMRLLGPDYVVWDKSGSIRFLKPGRGTLYARYVVPAAETDAIRQALKTQRSVDRIYAIELKSSDGTVHAVAERTLYVRAKNSPRQVTATPA
jgi:acyl-coenzyme A thioesterase PaaI-like protein